MGIHFKPFERVSIHRERTSSVESDIKKVDKPVSFGKLKVSTPPLIHFKSFNCEAAETVRRLIEREKDSITYYPHERKFEWKIGAGGNKGIQVLEDHHPEVLHLPHHPVLFILVVQLI